MLKLSNVNSFYGEVQVLKDVSMAVNQGEIVTLIGANAAGKSTLISCISRTVTSFLGEIEFEGKRIDQLRPDQVVDHGLIQIPEGRLLFPKLTVRENLELGAYQQEEQAQQERETGIRLRLASEAEGKSEPDGRFPKRRRSSDVRHRKRADGRSEAADV